MSGETASLRAATGADLGAVERLLREAELPVAGVRDAIGAFVVAEHRGELVGVAGVEPCGESGLLRSVAVVPAWRGRGLARALVSRVIGGAEAQGMSTLYLLTTTAAGYFPSFGFVETTRAAVPPSVAATEEFQSACPASAVVMVRAAGASVV